MQEHAVDTLPNSHHIPDELITPDQAQTLAPEFNRQPPPGIKQVGQGTFATLESGTFLTKAITACSVVLIKHTVNGRICYTLLHAMNSDLYNSYDGYGRDELRAEIGESPEAIIVTGSRSVNQKGLPSQLQNLIPGIHIKPSINMVTGNTWLHVAFRIDSNTLLTKVGSDEDFTVPIGVTQEVL